MAAPSLEERFLDLIDQADELAVGFMRLDADVRKLAKDFAAEMAAVREQARAAAKLEFDNRPAPRALTAVPPGMRR